MSFLGIDSIIFFFIIYFYVQQTAPKNASPRSKPTDALISPIYVLFPSQKTQIKKSDYASNQLDGNSLGSKNLNSKNNEKTKISINFIISKIMYYDFRELYHGIQVDFLLSSLIIGYITYICWEIINWIRILYYGTHFEITKEDFLTQSENYLQKYSDPEFSIYQLSDKSTLETLRYYILKNTFFKSFGNITLPENNWWIYLFILNVLTLIFFQWKIVWKRLPTFRGKLSISFSFVSWIFSLLILQTNDGFFTWNIDHLHKLIQDAELMKLHNFQFLKNILIFKLILSLICSLIMFTLVMPIIRMIHCHYFMSQNIYRECTKAKYFRIRLISTTNIFLPSIVSLLWFSFVRKLFYFIDDIVYMRIQIIGVLLISCLEFLSLWPYLQSFILKNGVDCTKEVEQKELYTEGEVTALKDRMLNGIRLTFVVVSQLIYIPSLLAIFALLLISRGNYSLGFGHPSISVHIESFDPILNFNSKESEYILLNMFGKTYNINNYSNIYSIQSNIITEFGGFICWWIILCTTLGSLLSYATKHAKQKIVDSQYPI